MNTLCPECEGTIELGDLMKGDVVSCPDCGVPFELTSTNPIKLEILPPDEEDFGE